MSDINSERPKFNRESFSDILAKIDPRSDGEKVGLSRFNEVCKQVEREYVDRGGAFSFVRTQTALEWALKRRGELCAT